MRKKDPKLERLFAPRGVCVIGASRNPRKLGYSVARNLIVSGYPGQLYYVNPGGGELFDSPMYPDIGSVPDPLDLAVIMIPAPSVPQVLEQCGERGVKYVIIGAGGFRETGPDGLALEEKCLAIAQAYGIRVLGPNCIGFLDTHLPIDTSFLPLPGPIEGDIAFLSHSGAICEAVIDWARGQGFGLSRLVSLGNQMDLNEADLLPPTAADPNTRVVAMYLEGVGDGPKFIEQARRVTREKPVVAIKVGKSQAGRAAVASHTGALAGEDAAYDAAFKKAGVIRARHSEEMFDWARALAWCPLPAGPSMAVLTNAGGPGAIATDSLVANGLQLAQLAEETTSKLGALLPEAASLKNPVDMLAGAGPREYADCLRALLRDDGVDGVMVILPPPPVTTAAEVAGAIIPVIQSTPKPVVVALMGEELIAHAAILFRGAHIPDYRFPERAASVLRVLWVRSQMKSEPKDQPIERYESDLALVRRTLDGAPVGRDRFIGSRFAAQVVEAYGIDCPEQKLARSEDEAVSLAEDIGYPLALKIESPDYPHKSDLGGVVTHIEDAAALRENYDAMSSHFERIASLDNLDGIIVQRMADEGIEVIVGMVRDPQFGPLIMFGSGGVEVEEMKDVAFELAPVNRREAEAMLERTWAGVRLGGLRGAPASDRVVVVDAILRIGQLAEDFPEVTELEINPLRVFQAGQGAEALDVRLRVSS
jgi:acetyltransferase